MWDISLNPIGNQSSITFQSFWNPIQPAYWIKRCTILRSNGVGVAAASNKATFLFSVMLAGRVESLAAASSTVSYYMLLILLCSVNSNLEVLKFQVSPGQRALML
ncbi:hypothetical protein QL285_027012 [Trifolium repens]|nr:hypothetical protein QL285_027012 [Trifolium repens]